MKDNAAIQFITDPRPDFDPVDQVEMVCAGGIRWIQMRLKEKSRQEKLRYGREINRVVKSYDSIFIVNDDVDIARELQADGVHLGLEDQDPVIARNVLGPAAIIGGTSNCYDDILLRHRQRVDYIGLGPFRFTSTKKKLSPVIGLPGYRKNLQRCRQERINIPIVAIGGISMIDIAPLRDVGVAGIAVSSLILDAPDPIARVQAIQEEFSCKRTR